MNSKGIVILPIVVNYGGESKVSRYACISHVTEKSIVLLTDHERIVLSRNGLKLNLLQTTRGIQSVELPERDRLEYANPEITPFKHEISHLILQEGSIQAKLLKEGFTLYKLNEVITPQVSE